MQKTLTEFIDEQNEMKNKDITNQKIDSQMYENLGNAYEYIEKQDSSSGRKTKSRMPTKQEFEEFIEQENK